MHNKSTKWMVAAAALVILVAGMTVMLLPVFSERSTGCGGGGACQDNLRTIDSAIMQYGAANNGSYPSSVEELVPNYLREAPECPATDTVYTLSETTPPRSVCPHPDPHTY